jgi:hypothetical protein
MLISRLKITTLAAALLVGLVTEANASDTLFQQFTGDYGVATSGWGSLADSGTMSVSIPVGATVTGAWLYQSTYNLGDAPTAPGGTFGGSDVNYSTALGVNSSACCNLQAYRGDVTSTVASAVDGGPGGTYNFSVSETDTLEQDGEALVVVYSLASIATNTVAILNGAASSAGDVSHVNFAQPLDPSAPGFFANMAIGDGFSCCGQASTITVNGQEMTTVAGNNDSSVDPSASNGNLITMGNIAGPYTGGTPGSPQTDYDADHEAYDLVPFLSNGDTTITIDTINASLDDNIFVQVLDVSGVASVTPGVPETSTWVMLLIGFGGLGYAARRAGKGRGQPATA